MQVAIYFFSPGLEKGGGSVQALMTARAIEAKGIKCDLIMRGDHIGCGDIVDKADVHHFVGKCRECIPLMKHIKRHGLGMIALSTIYWWTPRVQRILTPQWYKYMRYTLPRYGRRLLKGVLHDNLVYKLADLYLPNSPGEGRLVRRHLPVTSHALMCPVPNGVDPVDSANPVPDSSRPHLPKNYVLCAGTFNPRKNQLGLIRALRSTTLPVVFVGAIGLRGESDYASYYQQCRRESSKHMLFLEHQPHGSYEWHQLFSRARIFAMASACETPCLAALEAGLRGCGVAITEIGSTREYFGPYAAYIDPMSQESIRNAVMRAFESRPTALASHIRARFTWDKAAEVTIRAYELAIRRSATAQAEYENAVRGVWFDAE